MRTKIALALLIPCVACAPARDDAGPPDGTPTNDFQSALFTIVDHGQGASYQSANLVLVDQQITCDDLQWRGSLDVWSVPADVSWVTASMRHGLANNGWLRIYESLDQASVDGSTSSTDVQLFWGEVGLGPVQDDFPDGPVDTPTDPEGSAGRDVIAMIGVEQGISDELEVTVSGETTLGGALRTWQGDWSFAATKCDTVYEQSDGGTDPAQPPGDEDGDDSSEGNSGSQGSP